MSPTEKSPFADLLLTAYRFAGKTLTADGAADWWAEFERYPLAELDAAFRAHRRVSPYLPRPYDIHAHLEGADGRDGRPGPDEAWGILVRLAEDERETGVLTEEIREGWRACQSILEAGDPIGARKCFLEAYAKRVRDARHARRPVHWTVTLGTDPTLRKQRIADAVADRRLSADHAQTLLEGPSAESLDRVAKLLEGPDASAADRATAERFHEFATHLRKLLRDSGETERRTRAAAERSRRAREEAARASAVRTARDRAGAELPERTWREPPEGQTP